MVKKTIDVSYEFLDELVVEQLTQTRDILNTDLIKRKNGGTLGIFSMDREEDIVKIKKMIKTLNRVIKYYTPQRP